MCFFVMLRLKLGSKYMNHTEVLDRVGGLLLLPNTELATTKQFEMV